MNKLRISAFSLNLPMKVDFKHSSACRNVMDSIIVEAERNCIKGYGEGCPRSYVTGESVETGLIFINRQIQNFMDRFDDLNKMRDWVVINEFLIDKNPAAWCAVELALLDLFSKEADKSVEELLSLDEPYGSYQYTAVIGDSASRETEETLKRYLRYGFWDYKLKICGSLEDDRKKIAAFREIVLKGDPRKIRLRLDANNLWSKSPEVAAGYIKNLNYPLFAVEEPLSSGDFENLCNFSKDLDLPVILDESLCAMHDVECLSYYESKWIANIRISKMGGILRSLNLISKLKELGYGIIVGAHVGETSILSRAALIAAKASGKNLIAQEGAYGTILLSDDYFEPVIMFGMKGILELNKIDKRSPDWIAGFGLKKKNLYD